MRETVAEILESVAREGDDAVVGFTGNSAVRDLDARGVGRWARRTRCGPDRAFEGRSKAILSAKSNVRAFAKRSLRKNWFTKNRQGAIVGERFDPFQRVGIYVPGGTAPLVSTAVMTCTLAAAAGVAEIVAVTPSARDGSLQPALLGALVECGATEVYRVGRSPGNCRSRFRDQDNPAGAKDLRSGQRLRRGSKAAGIRSRRDRLASGPERNSCHRGRLRQSRVDCRRSPRAIRTRSGQHCHPANHLAAFAGKRGRLDVAATPPFRALQRNSALP